MFRPIPSLIRLAVLSVCLAEGANAQAPVDIGTRIYIKSPDAPIQVQNRTIGRGNDVAYPLTVRNVQDEWLWIWVETKKAEGWIRRSDVCTASEAITYFSNRIAANPDDADAYFRRKLAREDLGQLDGALDDATQCVRLSPSASSFNSRGAIWDTKKEYDIAIKDYNEAIRLDPKFASAYSNRGIAYCDKGELGKAIADYNEAINLDPKYSNAHNSRGNAYRKKGELDKAIADFNEAIRLDPKYSLAYNNRGNAYSDKGELDKAIADFNEAIRLDPKFALAYGGRGFAYSIKGELNKAIDDYNEAIRLDPNYAFAHFGRGNSRFLLRKPEAEADFQTVVELQGWQGDRAPYAVIMGHLSSKIHPQTQSIPFLKNAGGKLKSGWPDPVVQFLRGEIDERRLLELATDNDKKTEAHCYLGLEHFANGRKDAAGKEFDWVIQNGNRGFIEYGIAVNAIKWCATPAGR